ncbi:MAG: STAS domain-containing protein [Verrucomicrobiota bacterium]
MKHQYDSENATLQLTAEGDVTSTNVDSMRYELEDIYEKTSTSHKKKWSLLILDLSKSQMVDSAGLNLIISIVKRNKASGAEIKIITSSPLVHRVLTFTRLSKEVNIVLNKK